MQLHRFAIPMLVGLGALATVTACAASHPQASGASVPTGAPTIAIRMQHPMLESLPRLEALPAKAVSPSPAHAVVLRAAATKTGKGSPSVAKEATPTGTGFPARSSATSSTLSPGASTATSAMTVLGYWLQPPSDHSEASYVAHASSVSEVAPLWYSVRADGSVKQWWASVVPSVVALAHAHKTRVLPLVNLTTSGAPMLDDPSAISAAVANLTAIARANHFDGFNIDFEGIDGNQAQGLVSFMRQLHAALSPLGLETTIDVGPRESSTIPTGDQSAAYDYARLAPYVNQLAIMTYDEHCTGTGPGPVAGRYWVRAVIGYALSVGVPARKILIGIGDYGYDWTGQNPNAASLTDTQAEALAAAYGVPIRIDPVSGEAHFTYVAGGVTHEVWFENAASLAPKLSLAASDHVAGVALWVLGSEDRAIFPTIRADLGPIVP